MSGGIGNFYIKQLQNPNTNPFGTLQILIPKTSGLGDAAVIEERNTANSECHIFAIADSLSVSMSANWSPDATAEALQNEVDRKQNSAANSSKALGEIFKSFGLEGIGEGLSNMAGKRLKPLQTSYVAWQKSDVSPFSFKLSRIALAPEEDTTIPFLDLSRMVLPSYFSAGIVMTPGNYTPPYSENIVKGIASFLEGLGNIFERQDAKQVMKEDKPVPGTVTVKYGQWATLRNMLVTGLSFTPSKVCTKYGLPLYTTGKIDLIPYRMLLANDINSMFGSRGDIQHNISRDNSDLATQYGTTDLPPALFKSQKKN